ncbi:hypothetical protein ANCCEY_07173 [Ancylostoma ceylanicum]|uniref:Uncharacterized protein n=1 Tax=Ancylostoma ceylanicum TaxID=53326 RepID=A0A0D6LUI8_9BILA|nr:hypothetical protein ANCCEY_07173 [Ancylostoma ceylanicum]
MEKYRDEYGEDGGNLPKQEQKEIILRLRRPSEPMDWGVRLLKIHMPLQQPTILRVDDCKMSEDVQ